MPWLTMKHCVTDVLYVVARTEEHHTTSREGTHDEKGQECFIERIIVEKVNACTVNFGVLYDEEIFGGFPWWRKQTSVWTQTVIRKVRGFLGVFTALVAEMTNGEFYIWMLRRDDFLRGLNRSCICEEAERRNGVFLRLDVLENSLLGSETLQYNCNDNLG